MCVRPLEEELVCGAELCRQAPLAEPERRVAEGGVRLDAVQVWERRKGVRGFNMGVSVCGKLTADARQVGFLVCVSNALGYLTLQNSESFDVSCQELTPKL